MHGVEADRAVLIQVRTEGKAQLDMDGVLHLLKQGITDFLGKNPFDQFVLVMEVVVEALAVQGAALADLGDGDFLQRCGLQHLFQCSGQRSLGDYRVGHMASILINLSSVG